MIIIYKLSEINPEMIITQCPHGLKDAYHTRIRVGSFVCCSCKYFVSKNNKKKEVHCSLRNTHKVVPVNQCRQECHCECKTGGLCNHDFSGPVVYTKNSGSVVCQNCGMTAMAHDMLL